MFECFSALPLRVQIMQQLHGTHARQHHAGNRARAEERE